MSKRKTDWSIHLRGNVWHAYIKNPRRGGEPVRISTGCRDEEKAREWARKYYEELWAVKVLGQKPARLWAEAGSRWLIEKEGIKRSIRTDRQRLRTLHPYFQGKTLTDITRDFMDDLMLKFMKERGISKATANRYTALVSAILNTAMREWEWIDKVPTFRMHQEDGVSSNPLTVEQFDLLMNDEKLLKHQKFGCLLGVATGLRKSNVSAMEWRWINFDRKMIVIPAERFKGKRAMIVPLNETAMWVLKQLWGDHPEYVITYNGNPVKELNTRAWRKALRRNGIVNVTWHGLRHTFASWLGMLGATDRELQSLGGWKSAKMVAKYTHLPDNHLLAVSSKLDTIFTQSLGRERVNEK